MLKFCGEVVRRSGFEFNRHPICELYPFDTNPTDSWNWNLLADQIPPTDNMGGDKVARADQPHPTLTSSWASILTFHWANGLMVDGYFKHRAVEKAISDTKAGKKDPETGQDPTAEPLNADDIWPLPPDKEAHAITAEFIKEWENELAAYPTGSHGDDELPPGLKQLAAMDLELNSTIVGVESSNLPHGDKSSKANGTQTGIVATGDKKKGPSLFRAVWKTYKTKFLWSGVLRLIADGCGIASPLVLRQLIIFLSEASIAYSAGTPGPQAWRGYMLSFGLGMILLVQSFAMSFTWVSNESELHSRAHFQGSVGFGSIIREFAVRIRTGSI